MAQYGYFNNFGKIQYNGQNVVNIIARPKILNKVSANPYAFYPYPVKQFDRPDTIANEYYSDYFFSWIVYLSNKIIDPYYGWPMEYLEFEQFIQMKYESAEKAQRTIIGYRVNWDDDPSLINVSAYNAMSELHMKYWKPVFSPANGQIIGYDRAHHSWTSSTNYYQAVQPTANATFEVGDLVSLKLGNTTTAQATVFAVNTTSVILQHLEGAPQRFLEYTIASGNVLTTGETATISNATVNATVEVYSSNSTKLIVSYNGNTYPTDVVTAVGATSAQTAVTTSTAPLYSVLHGDYSGQTTPISNSTLLGYSIAQDELSYWAPWYAYDFEDERNAALRNIRLLDSAYSIEAYLDLKRLMK